MKKINSRNPVVPIWHIHSKTKMYLFNSVLELVSPSMIGIFAEFDWPREPVRPC